MMHGLFRGSTGNCERFVEFPSHLRNGRRGVKAILPGINLPKRRMIFDSCVEPRLRDGRIVYFAMAMAAESDEIDHDVARELRSVIGGHFAHADDGVGILSVYVENGNGLPFSQIGRKARGVQLNRWRGE